MAGTTLTAVTYDGAYKTTTHTFDNCPTDWVHAATVFKDGEPVGLYVNSSLTTGDTIGNMRAPQDRFTVGNRYGDPGSAPAGVTVDDFRMNINESYTQTDVDKIYNNGDGTSDSLADVPDTTPPFINITSPINNSVHTVDFVDLNWTINKTPASAVYSLDNGSNVSMLSGLGEGNETMIITECYDNHGGVDCSVQSVNDNDWSTSSGLTNSPTDDSATFEFIFTRSLPGTISDFALRVKCESQGLSSSFLSIYNWSSNQFTFVEDYQESPNKVCSEPAGFSYLNFSNDDVTHFIGGSATNFSYKFTGVVGTSSTDHLLIFETNVSYDEGLSSEFVNTTLTSLSEGLHNVTIWANDSLGNMGQSDYTYWTVDLPEPPVTEGLPRREILTTDSTLGGRKLLIT